MMTREEKLTEAKLMAVEEIIDHYGSDDFDYDSYEVAKEILLAIHNAEIAEELRKHEAGLETDEHGERL